MTTEVYICREGQSLKEGQVQYAAHIENRDEAASDAERRCQNNTWIEKIAYYKVDEMGDFRVIYTHKNPNFVAKAQGAAGDAAKKKKKRKKKPKKTLWQKLLGR